MFRHFRQLLFSLNSLVQIKLSSLRRVILPETRRYISNFSNSRQPTSRTFRLFTSKPRICHLVNSPVNSRISESACLQVSARMVKRVRSLRAPSRDYLDCMALWGCNGLAGFWKKKLLKMESAPWEGGAESGFKTAGSKPSPQGADSFTAAIASKNQFKVLVVDQFPIDPLPGFLEYGF